MAILKINTSDGNNLLSVNEFDWFYKVKNLKLSKKNRKIIYLIK